DQDLQTEQKKPGWSIEQLEANLTANLKKVFEERRRKEEKELSDRKKAEEWLYKPENRQLTTDVRAQMTSALQALGYRVPTSQNQDPPPHN
ncbi:MAG: hypothetical protein KDK40_01325, partial [Chlamydiia bacterium]|nr:hypothetical protein [Chlamydiia bacterium]